MKMEPGSEGYTGKMFEDEVLPRISDDWKNEGYFDEPKSYEWVMTHQPWNPSDPQVAEGRFNTIANNLHYKIADAMGLEDVNELKFFTALDSPLDKFYGIDAFFQYKNAIFTIDLTSNPHKKEYKADLVVTPDDMLDEESMDRVAKEIASFIKRRAEERGRLAA